VLILRDTDAAAAPAQRSVVTIGAYDGVHKGHRAVIAHVQAEAKRLGCQGVVVTFDHHPASVVRPESAPKLLTDSDQKIELLAGTGIDATFMVHFDEAASKEDPAAFVKRVFSTLDTSAAETLPCCANWASNLTLRLCQWS